MAINKEDFCRALSELTGGVTVVTTRCKEDNPWGVTVTSFTSLSLEPPLVLICIYKSAKIHTHLREGAHFGVNILSEDQEPISRRFASKEPDRFAGIAYSYGVTGVPLLKGCLANIECKILNTFPGGDHTIFVGEVETAAVSDGNPLAYFRRNYVRVQLCSPYTRALFESSSQPQALTATE